MTGPGDQVPYDQLDSMDQAAMHQAQMDQLSGTIVSPLGLGGAQQAAAAAEIADIQHRAGQKAELAQAMSAGTSMRVDPDQVDKLAAFFEERAQEVVDRSMDLSERLPMIPPPGTDPVSTQATDRYLEVASGSGDGYIENYQKLSDVFRATAHNLRASAQQTRMNEQDAMDSFGGGKF